jgi:hypothetical protein
MERFVIALPHKERGEEDAFQVEIIVGKEMAWPLVIVGMLMGFALILVQVRSPMLVAVGVAALWRRRVLFTNHASPGGLACTGGPRGAPASTLRC